MGSLSSTLQNKSLRELKIPGSHDAGTGAWQQPLTVVNDRGSTNSGLYKAWEKLHDSKFFPWAANILAERIGNLGHTQSGNFSTQLLAGSRYFDVRLFNDSASGEVYMTHTLLGEQAFHAAASIRDFLEQSPDEIIILQERQREGFTSLAAYEEFLNRLFAALGGIDRMIPSNATWGARYGTLIRGTGRVIYIACHENTSDPPCQALSFQPGPTTWSSSVATTLWPNAQSSEKIEQAYSRVLPTWAKESDTLCVSQVRSQWTQHHEHDLLG